MRKISYSKFPPKCAHAQILVAILDNQLEIDCNYTSINFPEDSMHPVFTVSYNPVQANIQLATIMYSHMISLVNVCMVDTQQEFHHF